MPVTKRTLTNWRRQALLIGEEIEKNPTYPISPTVGKMLLERIIRMTQELLDQHLIRKG